MSDGRKAGIVQCTNEMKYTENERVVVWKVMCADESLFIVYTPRLLVDMPLSLPVEYPSQTVTVLVLSQPRLVSLFNPSVNPSIHPPFPQLHKLTSTRRPIMYKLAPKLLNSMTLYAGIMYLPRACGANSQHFVLYAGVAVPMTALPTSCPSARFWSVITHLLPRPQAIVLLELALVVGDAVLAEDPAAHRQLSGIRKCACSGSRCASFIAVMRRW